MERVTPNLIIIRGIPGTGKSTLARQLIENNEYNITHWEADMFFHVNGRYEFDRTQLREAHAWCQDNVKRDLAAGFTVIVSNTFTTMKEMEPYFEMIHAYGKHPTVFIAQTEWGSIHSVPHESLQVMRDRFQYDITSLYQLLQTTG